MSRPRKSPEAHQAEMNKLSQRMARDWNTVFDKIEGRGERREG